MILVDDKDMHKVLDELKFQPNLTTDYLNV